MYREYLLGGGFEPGTRHPVSWTEAGPRPTSQTSGDSYDLQLTSVTTLTSWCHTDAGRGFGVDTLAGMSKRRRLRLICHLDPARSLHDLFEPSRGRPTSSPAR
jgi:hypothetical protein